jgi:hypothetical protein
VFCRICPGQTSTGDGYLELASFAVLETKFGDKAFVVDP